MKPFRRLTSFVTAFSLVAVIPAASLLAQQAEAPQAAADPNAVLKAIPADATAFVVLRNLKELDSDVTGISQAVGFPLGGGGPLPGLLDLVMEEGGLGTGLNSNGSAAAVLLNCRNLKDMEEMPTRVVLLLPCTDGKELALSMGGTELEGGMYSVHMMGMPSVAAPKDGFLIVAQTPDAVKALASAEGPGIIKTIAPDRLEAYGKSDLLLWANLDGMSDEVMKQVEQNLTELSAMFAPGGAPLPGGTPATRLFAQLKQIQELTLSVNADPAKGLHIQGYSRLKPDAEQAAWIAGMKAADGSLLAGLPLEDTVLSFGFMGHGSNPSTDKEIRNQISQLAANPMLGGLVTEEEAGSLADIVINLMSSFDQAAVSVSSLPGTDGNGVIGLTKVAKVKNSEQTIAQMDKFVELLKAVVHRAAAKEFEDEAQLKAIDEMVVWKKSAEQLAGAPVHHLMLDLSKVPDVGEADLAELKKIAGNEGLLFRVAVVAEDRVAVGFGGGPERMTKVIESARKGDTALADDPMTKKLAERLPSKGRLLEGYIHVDHGLKLVLSIMARVGSPMPPLTMKETLPVGFNMVKHEGAAQEFNLVVPVELAVSVREVIMQGMMMMMGGMGGEEGEPQQLPPGGQLN